MYFFPLLLSLSFFSKLSDSLQITIFKERRQKIVNIHKCFFFFLSFQISLRREEKFIKSFTIILSKSKYIFIYIYLLFIGTVYECIYVVYFEGLNFVKRNNSTMIQKINKFIDTGKIIGLRMRRQCCPCCPCAILPGIQMY